MGELGVGQINQRRLKGRFSLAPGNYMFLLPAVLLVGVTVIGGVGYTLHVSTLRWVGFGPAARWVGLANYARLLTDPVFHQTLINSGWFTVVFVGLQMTLGLTMAVCVKAARFGTILCGTIFFLPVVLAHAVSAQLFAQLLAPEGEVNLILRAIGMGGLAQSWLAEPNLALFALAGVNVWNWAGFAYIVYLAALGQVDGSVLEAASIDGAGPLTTLRRIILPLLWPTHAALLMLGVIGAIKTFDLIYLTTGGGPAGSTELLPLYIFHKAIFQFDAGYASALSIALLVIALLLTAIQIVVLRQPKGSTK